MVLDLDIYIFPWHTFFWGGHFQLQSSCIRINTVFSLQNFQFVPDNNVFNLLIALDIEIQKGSPTETSSDLCHTCVTVYWILLKLGRKSSAYFKALHCTTGCTDVNHKHFT